MVVAGSVRKFGTCHTEIGDCGADLASSLRGTRTASATLYDASATGGLGGAVARTGDALSSSVSRSRLVRTSCSLELTVRTLTSHARGSGKGAMAPNEVATMILIMVTLVVFRVMFSALHHGGMDGQHARGKETRSSKGGWGVVV